jgi:hypothetical protein
MAKIGSSVIADKHARYRVKFITDPDARFEEMNGESRPLTAAEYAGNEYLGCPDGHHTGSDPAKSHDGIGYCAECGKRYEQIPYAEYRKYYGNPKRHVYLMCVYQVGCACCDHWQHERHYLGNIDHMDDNPELVHRGKWLTPEYLEANKATLGYLYEVGTDAIKEAVKHG